MNLHPEIFVYTMQSIFRATSQISLHEFQMYIDNECLADEYMAREPECHG